MEYCRLIIISTSLKNSKYHLGDFPVDAGYRLLAAKYVRKQAKQLRTQFDGIRMAEDIEFVHRARVASRRLRAAMRMFGECFKRKQLKRWKKAIRFICSELGEARDKDVQIELLHSTLASITDQINFAGISRLLVEWERRRERLQSNVVKAVDRLQQNGTLKDVENAAKNMLGKAQAHEVQVQSSDSFARAEQEILKRLDELLNLQDCLGRPDDRQNHHAMRIAAKRLRYTLEIARPIYSGKLDATLEAIKQVQTLLGDVHDCDVWQEQLDQFAKTERGLIKFHYGHSGPFNKLNAGIEFFRQDRQRHRQQCFDQLVRTWGEFDVQEIWENLVGIVQAYDELSESAISTEEKQNAIASSERVIEHQLDAEVPETVQDDSGNGDPTASPALSLPCTPTLGKHRTPVIS
jgi:CHAD domain-containing protein